MWEVLEEYICWKISLERGSWAYICLSWCEWTQGNWGADKTGGTVFYLIWANILNWREYFRKLLHQRTVQVVSLRLVSVCCGSFGFVHSELGGWGGGMGWEKGFWWSTPVAVCFSMYLHGHQIYVRHSLLSLFVLCVHEGCHDFCFAWRTFKSIKELQERKYNQFDINLKWFLSSFIDQHQTSSKEISIDWNKH